MKTFKSLAYEILKKAGKPLHVEKITKLALEQGLVSLGKTPHATMNAVLITDINRLKQDSKFKKVAPATFTTNDSIAQHREQNTLFALEDSNEIPISKISSKQKGDIAEARIAELITLYGKSSMGCYKPISDDEGIDLIVKNKGSTEIMYLQIKSRFSYGLPKPYTATVKTSGVHQENSMGIVFCSFDYDKGDLRDYLRFVPASDFQLLANKLDGGDRLGFVSGTSRKSDNKRDKYLIDKRTLSEEICKQMSILAKKYVGNE